MTAYVFNRGILRNLYLPQFTGVARLTLIAGAFHGRRDINAKRSKMPQLLGGW